MKIPSYKGKGLFSRGKIFSKNPGVFISENEKELGGVFILDLLIRKVLCVTDPEVIGHILQKEQKKFKKSFAYKELRLALGMGLVTSEGDFWRKQRRLAQPAFYKTQLEELFKGMFEKTEEYIEELEKKRGTVVDISGEMMKITADVVLKTLFSTDNNIEQEKMYRQMVGAQEYVIHRINHPLLRPFNYINGRHRAFLRDKSGFDKTIFDIIGKREGMSSPPNDLLNMLISAKDADTGEGMSKQQLRDEAITIFAAGHETSANALAWTLSLLSKHPEVVKKMREELWEVLDGRLPKFNDLRQLQYTKQVIEEGMRLYPPAHALGREPLEANEINGIKIEKKMVVLISVFALHRSERFWEKPEEFNPDRFSPEKVKARPKNVYMPFGAGPRMCIGNHFAIMEMQLILASLVQKFDFEWVEGQKLEMQALITLKPKENIRLRLV